MKNRRFLLPLVARMDLSLSALVPARQGRGRTGFCIKITAALLVILCSMPAISYAKRLTTDEECTAAHARPMSVAEASRGGKAREGLCIRVTGIANFWTLYGSVADIYRTTRTWQNRARSHLKVAPIGIGVFPDDEDGTERGWPWTADAPHRITLVGRLHECGRDPETGKPFDGYAMELNWCHHNGGTLVDPGAVLADDPVELARMTGKRAWRQFGDIVLAKRGSALEVNAVEYVRRMFLAAHKGDRRAILDLNDFSNIELSADGTKISENGEHRLIEAQDILDLWFGNSNLVISQVAKSAVPPAVVRIFEQRWKGKDQGPWACWAAAPLAESDWPISSVDTGNVAGRPYACVELVTKLYEPDQILVGMSRRGWSFREPLR